MITHALQVHYVGIKV